ncbi:SIR2 family protein [Cobetia marina]|uniref:SIR2 family protein n=1 Tax=Cobetia marina TaxID=28258 RepID=UPI0026E47261|nr:SIR2 family protein [Cobetia marina]MDO6787183.1 SIR2 family protein [Cobetia marina]
MEIFNHDDPVILNILSEYFHSASLVPIFGAGFTRGELSRHSSKRIPDGNELKDSMLKQIKEAGVSEEEYDEIKVMDLPDISDIYFNEKFVPKNKIRETLENSFLNAALSSEKLSLLNDIKWKYVYTFNIDDAIERNTRYTAVYPYDESLSDSSRNYFPVYKLHGDVYYELTHDSKRLVFKKASYIESIAKNHKMLSMLKEDMINKNLIYIGCSLKSEDDIAYIVSSKSEDSRKMTRRIAFRSKVPNRVDATKLENHGINTVILTDKGKYDQQYQLLQSAYLKSACKSKDVDKFDLVISPLPKDKDINLKFLTDGVVSVGGSYGTGASAIPYYYGIRDQEKKLKAIINEKGIVVVSGSRVSGKTLMVKSVVGNIKDKKVVFIESGTTLESDYVNLLMGLSNAVIVFDAKTLDIELAKVISKNISRLIENNTCVISIVDNADGLIVDELNSFKYDKLPTIVLDKKFSKLETSTVNMKLRSVGCPSFSYKVKLLDNLFSTYESVGGKEIIEKMPKDKNLLVLLYVISAKRKFEGDWIRFLGLSSYEFEELMNIVSPYLECIKVGRIELASHAGFNVICNSDVWLLSVIHELYYKKGVAWCVDALIGLIEVIPEDESRLSIELTLFDNLNFAFAGRMGGAAEIILELYEKLEKIRISDPEFYVQKAKAYNKMYRKKDVVTILNKRIEELVIAMTWVCDNKNSRTLKNLRNMIALVSIRRAYEDGYNKIEYLIEAIERSWVAINDEKYNSQYVENLFSNDGLLARLIGHISSGGVNDVRILSIKDKVDVIRSRIY